MTADSTMLKQFSPNIIVVTIETAVPRVQQHNYCRVYHICRQSKKKTLLVFSSEDRISVKLLSHKTNKKTCCSSVHDFDACSKSY